jgi:hypothetical protein
MGVSRAIKLRVKTDRNMAKTEVTIPLGIADVRVLKSEVGERPAANAGNGSQNSMGKKTG